METEEDIQRFYRTNRRYFSKLKEKEFDDWFKKYHKSLTTAEEGMILDVGCGTGQVVNRLAADGLEAIGIDISPVGIRLSNAARSSTEASFIIASSYKLPFRDNIFNAVGCLDVLEHLSLPEQCIDDMIRVAIEEGKIVIASPNLLCPIYAKNPRRALSMMKTLFQRLFNSERTPTFEHREPVLDDSETDIERDLDAITLLDPSTLKRLLVRRGIKITSQSSYLGSKKTIEILSRLPVLRSIGGGIFLVGKKRRNREHSTTGSCAGNES